MNVIRTDIFSINLFKKYLEFLVHANPASHIEGEKYR
jgi:hypothetical protein